MRDLAKSRKADAKAEAAIPDWIREADKAKPAEHLDLGWRQVAPKREEIKVPTAAERAVEQIRRNRPKSGTGIPFGGGLTGGRWRVRDARLPSTTRAIRAALSSPASGCAGGRDVQPAREGRSWLGERPVHGRGARRLPRQP